MQLRCVDDESIVKSLPGIAPIPGPLADLGFNSPVGIVLWTIGLGTSVRLLCAATAIDLSYGEAYYVAPARHFALSYFDHPPLSFWIAAAIMKLTGSDALFVLRVPFILIFAATTWLMYRVGALLFGERAGALSALLLNISPLFAISIGAWVEPDGPLIFCILASTFCVVRLAYASKPSAEISLWAQAGLWLGLAMLAKYYAVLLPIGIALFTLTSREHRQWFRKPGPYIACAIAFAVFSPVFFWNFQNDWISFRFQGVRAVDFSGIGIKRLLTNIFGQAAFIGPWIWAHMLFKNSLRPARDFTLSGLEWKELRTAIGERHLLDERRLFVATAHRVEIGKIDLEIGKFLPVVCMCGDPRNIAFGWNLDKFLAWDALIIGTDLHIPNVLEAYGSYFRKIEPLDNVEIHRGGRVVLTLRVYYAKHYLGSYPLPFGQVAEQGRPRKTSAGRPFLAELIGSRELHRCRVGEACDADGDRA